MKKRIITIVIAAAVVLLGGVAFGLVKHNQSASNNNVTSTSGSTSGTDTSASTESSGSRKISIPKWGVTFQLPSNIAVTEIQMAKDTSVNTDALIIGDSVVASGYNASTCSGNNVALGEIFSIFRFDTKKDGTKKLGNSYYKVVEPLATQECYSHTIWQKYFASSVRQSAQDSLELAK